MIGTLRIHRIMVVVLIFSIFMTSSFPLWNEEVVAAATGNKEAAAQGTATLGEALPAWAKVQVEELVAAGLIDGYDPHSGRWTAKDPILLDGEQSNLYAYVNNNPIQYRDPCGLFCVGASAYEGLGGGGKVCITDEGFSACVEAGVGVGGGFEINPVEDLSNTELAVEAAFKASWGPASFSDGIKLTSKWNGDCPEISLLAKAELGPFGYDFMSPSESSINLEQDHFNTDVNDAKNLFKKTGTSFEAALKTKACAQYKW